MAKKVGEGGGNGGETEEQPCSLLLNNNPVQFEDSPMQRENKRGNEAEQVPWLITSRQSAYGMLEHEEMEPRRAKGICLIISDFLVFFLIECLFFALQHSARFLQS